MVHGSFTPSVMDVLVTHSRTACGTVVHCLSTALDAVLKTKAADSFVRFIAIPRSRGIEPLQGLLSLER